MSPSSCAPLGFHTLPWVHGEQTHTQRLRCWKLSFNALRFPLCTFLKVYKLIALVFNKIILELAWIKLTTAMFWLYAFHMYHWILVPFSNPWPMLDWALVCRCVLYSRLCVVIDTVFGFFTYRICMFGGIPVMVILIWCDYSAAIWHYSSMPVVIVNVSAKRTWTTHKTNSADMSFTFFSCHNAQSPPSCPTFCSCAPNITSLKSKCLQQ